MLRLRLLLCMRFRMLRLRLLLRLRFRMLGLCLLLHSRLRLPLLRLWLFGKIELQRWQVGELLLGCRNPQVFLAKPCLFCFCIYCLIVRTFDNRKCVLPFGNQKTCPCRKLVDEKKKCALIKRGELSLGELILSVLFPLVTSAPEAPLF